MDFKKLRADIKIDDNTKKKSPFYELYIKGDINDADYIVETTEFNEEELKDNYFFSLLLYAYNFELPDKDNDAKNTMEVWKYVMENICYPTSDYGNICHSLDTFKLTYFDAYGINHDVTLPKVNKEELEEFILSYNK